MFSYFFFIMNKDSKTLILDTSFFFNETQGHQNLSFLCWNVTSKKLSIFFIFYDYFYFNCEKLNREKNKV
jgi:hypothetical protein